MRQKPEKEGVAMIRRFKVKMEWQKQKEFSDSPEVRELIGALMARFGRYEFVLVETGDKTIKIYRRDSQKEPGFNEFIMEPDDEPLKGKYVFVTLNPGVALEFASCWGDVIVRKRENY